MALTSSPLWFILGDFNRGVQLLPSLVVLYISHILKNEDPRNTQRRPYKAVWQLVTVTISIKTTHQKTSPRTCHPQSLGCAQSKTFIRPREDYAVLCGGGIRDKDLKKPRQRYEREGWRWWMMNDGRSGASSAISGIVLFRLCQPKMISMMEFMFLICSRTSHVTKIDICFFNALRNGRCVWVWRMRYIFWSEIGRHYCAILIVHCTPWYFRNAMFSTVT